MSIVRSAAAPLACVATLALGSIAVAQGEPGPALRLRPERTVAPAEPVDVEMTMRGQQPAVHVRVNGQGPFLFAIDTGGSGAARIDDDLVSRLGLEPSGTIVGGDPSGRPGREMEVYELESIELGGLRFEGLTAPSRDYDHPSLPHVDGILGWHLFSELVLTLDYAGGRVVCASGPFEPPAGARPVPLLNEPDGLPEVALAVDGELLGRAWIDSGKMGGVHLPAAWIEQLELASEPVVIGRGRTVTGEFEIRRAPLAGELDVAGVRIARPDLEFSDVMPAAIVGSGFLAGRTLTLDPRGRRAWLRGPEDDARRGLLRYRPERTELSEPVTVPLELVGGRPWVEVRIADRGPYRLLVDTGAPGSVLDDDLVRELELATTGETELLVPMGGVGVAATEHRIPSLALGAARFEGLPCTAMDLDAVFQMAGEAPDGILGLATFADAVVVFDLGGGELRVEPGRLPLPDGETVLPLTPDEHALPRLAIEVCGRAIDAHLDTGNPGSLTLPEDFARALPLASEPVVIGRGRTISGSFEVSQAQVDGALAIGAATSADPLIHFHEGLPVANLGSALLGRFELAIDLSGWRLRLTERGD